MKNAASSLRERATTSWERLAPRERNLVSAAVTLVVVALVWWVAISPALNILKNAPVRHAALDAQLQDMLKLQSEALKLQSEPKIDPSQAQASLQAATRATLGESAQLRIVGDRATVTLKNVPPDTLARWIAQARINARAVVVESRLIRNAGAGATAGAGSPAGWDGTITLGLPAR